MKTIKLSQGKRTMVDDVYFDWLNQWKWFFNGRYAVRTPHKLRGSKVIRMHRVITKVSDDMEVDHINGDKLDNRLINLRICTHSENCKNMKIYNTNTTGYKGVSRRGNSWRSRIRVDGKLILLGTYDTPEKAAIAYNDAAIRHHGRFARLNIISEVINEN